MSDMDATPAPETSEEPTARATAEQRPERSGDRGERGGDRGERGGDRGGRRFYRRKKVDFFSVNKIDIIDYKDAETLKQFLGDGAKIPPRRHTGLSAHHQRMLKRAIKRARNIALLPFAGEG
jgi:small subunit ribosomal protein S18